MATKLDLSDWVVDALKDLGGSARIVDICRHVWDAHKDELEKSGDLFYTWQYDIRWAAQKLRDSGICKENRQTPRGVWELS